MRYSNKSPAVLNVPTLVVTDENGILVHVLTGQYKIARSMRPSSIPISVARMKRQAMPLCSSQTKTLVDRQANGAVLERSNIKAFGASSKEGAEPSPRETRCLKRVDAITKRRGGAVAKRRREDC